MLMHVSIISAVGQMRKTSSLLWNYKFLTIQLQNRSHQFNDVGRKLKTAPNFPTVLLQQKPGTSHNTRISSTRIDVRQKTIYNYNKVKACKGKFRKLSILCVQYNCSGDSMSLVVRIFLRHIVDSTKLQCFFSILLCCTWKLCVFFPEIGSYTIVLDYQNYWIIRSLSAKHKDMPFEVFNLKSF